MTVVSKYLKGPEFQDPLFKMVLGLAPDPSKWVSIYFPVSWLTQVYIYGYNHIHLIQGSSKTWQMHFTSPVWPRSSDNSGWANPTLPRPKDRGRYWHHQPCLDLWLLWIHGDQLYHLPLSWHKCLGYVSHKLNLSMPTSIFKFYVGWKPGHQLDLCIAIPEWCSQADISRRHNRYHWGLLW